MAGVRGTDGKFHPKAEDEEPRPMLREVKGVQILDGPRGWAGEADGLPEEVPEDHMRVYCLANVLGGRANHWADVPKTKRDLELCLRKGLVQIEGPTGQPGFARLPPRACCGNTATPGQH